MCPHSDYAAVAASGSSRPPAPQVKYKKIVVNLPKEEITGDNGQVVGRASWARNPLSDPVILPLPDVTAVETISTEIYPPNDWRCGIPPTIDIFLPGKSAWDTMEQMTIKEKLEKLGVERGSGSNILHIYAPRAVSISSPVDPVILFFKLNKLQQSQDASSTKAVLGGPNRKVSPIPRAAVAASGSSTLRAPQTKSKKIVVNLPTEDITGDNGQVVGRASWARNPLSDPVILPLPDVTAVETISTEIYPPNDWRCGIPPTIDIFLPGNNAWDTMKQMAIEEKLEKLSVENGSGSSVPHIYAPHAHAASISSPADPALLLFKLNKLQQSQNASSNNSLVPSPQPSFGMSPSPHQQGPRFMMNRHGHNMSLAQPSTQSQYPYNNGSVVSLNPFGHDAALGFDQLPSRSSRVSPGPPGIGEIHAPQGRVPVALPSLAPPLSISRPDSRPDFTRGFDLDIPKEKEEEVEGVAEDENTSHADSDEEGFDEEPDDDEDRGTQDAGMTTASQSQRHSRHTSKLSAALSLRSFGVFNVDGLNERTDLEPTADGNISMEEKHDLDGIEEWTGSEDVFMGHECSDDESIDKWSNPSDEEMARQQRLERRALQQDDLLQEPFRKRSPQNETSTVTHPFVMRAVILAVAFAVLSVLAQSNDSVPVNYGIVVFPAFQALDVFGPLDALNMLSFAYSLNLSIIAETLDPVTTKPQSSSMNSANSNFSESIVPTHTFDSPPESLDVLIVPGGLGTRASNLNTTIDYIAATYPSLQYLITVCTGATLAARAGVLDGKNATTNKKSWEWATSQGPNVNWISHTRWVVDGNIYTTSGVSAGIDGVFAFMEAVYGANATKTVANSMEYMRETNSSWDPFAELYGL